MKKLFIYFFSIILCLSCSSVQVNKDTHSISGLSEDVQKYLYMPNETEVIMSESVVIGKDDNWVGKLTLLTNNEIEKTYSFIRDKYIENGWALKATYQSENAFLVFEKKNKLITIDISLNGLIKSKVKIIFTLSET